MITSLTQSDIILFVRFFFHVAAGGIQSFYLSFDSRRSTAEVYVIFFFCTRQGAVVLLWQSQPRKNKQKRCKYAMIRRSPLCNSGDSHSFWIIMDHHFPSLLLGCSLFESFNPVDGPEIMCQLLLLNVGQLLPQEFRTMNTSLVSS